jgi:predicted Zn-dependent protease
MLIRSTRAWRTAALRPLVLLLALLTAAGCQSSQNFITGEKQPGAYTWAQEVQIGRESDPQIVAQFGEYDDPQVQQYVDRISEQVLAASALRTDQVPAEVRSTPFTFRVLDSPVVNAFALPGGFIYVTRGLMTHLNNEAQLAVVIGHEIGHVAGRHASNQAATAQRNQLGLVGAAILSEAVLGGGGGTILQQGSQALGLLSLKYGRDAERQSDEAGVAWAEFAGYDASSSSEFFRSLQRLSAESGQAIPTWMSSHPDPGERAQTVVQLAAQYPSGTEVGRDQYLSVLEGMVLGENPRNGFFENGRFYQPDLRIQFAYPNGWRTQNAAQFVQIADPNGGQAMILQLSQAGSAQAAAQAAGQQQGVRVISSTATRVSGLPAVRMELEAQGQQGALGAIVYYIEQGGLVYDFMGIAAGALPTALDQYLQSFGTVSDPAILNRQPTRLEVVRASRTASFASFLQGRPMPPGMDENGLAILNQVNLNDTITAGTQLKLPRD